MASLLASCACLLVACGGRDVLRGQDMMGPAEAGDSLFRDGASDRPSPPLADAAIEGAVDTADARTDAPDAAVDAADAAINGAVDAAEARTDAADAIDAQPDVPVIPQCPVDCDHLPHVRVGTAVACRSGVCVVPSGSCEDGFAHCSVNPNDGCEANLSSPITCGDCYTVCFYPNVSCVNDVGRMHCNPFCDSPTPDVCDYSCTNFQIDPNNCGGCGRRCYLANAVSACSQGQCTFVRCMDTTWADCTADPGCETQLGSDGACAACGDRSCALANTLFTCASADACATAVCASGFGNCDAASPDCETAFAAGGSCLPGYLGTTPLATQALNDAVVAIGTDGSYFLGGEFSGTVDFDPTAGEDIRTTVFPSDADGFITKINADGSYAWTRTFVGRGAMALHGLAAAAGGAVVAVGWYTDSVDLDPGAAADLHQTVAQNEQDALIVKLAGDGSFVWGRTFSGVDSSSVSSGDGVAVDAADAVYVAGAYLYTVDFDPGPGTAVRAINWHTGSLVKLTASGSFSWVQTIDDGEGCESSLRSVAVSTDGTIWSVGSASAGTGCKLGSPPEGDAIVSAALILSTRAAGDAQRTWTLGDGTGPLPVSASAVAAGPSGSVYIGGTASGLVDLDPGPGVAARWLGGWPAGYILKLGSDASFLWAETVASVGIVSLAATPDGGVLGGGTSEGAFLTRLNGDGTAAWTFTSGGPATTATVVVARGASFAVAGASSGSGDFDPGTGIDIVSGDILFLSRYGL